MRLHVALACSLLTACSGTPQADAGSAGGAATGGGLSATGGGAATGGGGGRRWDAGPAPSNALDPTFGDGGSVTTRFGANMLEEFTALASLADGTVYAAGDVSRDGTSVGLGNDVGIARLLPNGALDAAFGVGGQVRFRLVDGSHRVRAIFPMDAGVVVAVYPSNGLLTLVKLTPAGAMDRTFGDGGIVTTWAGGTGWLRQVVRDGDGFLVVSRASLGSGTELARYDSTGKLDRGFGVAGSRRLEGPLGGSPRFGELRVQHLLRGADGGLWFAGRLNADIGVARMGADGGADDSLGAAAVLVLPAGDADVVEFLELADGSLRLLLKVTTTGSTTLLAGVASGRPDARLGDGGVKTLSSRSWNGLAEVKPNVVGSACVFDDASSDPEVGATDFAWGQFLLDGTLDPAAPNGGYVVAHVPNTSVLAATVIARAGDGKVLLAGSQCTGQGSQCLPTVCRVNVP